MNSWMTKDKRSVAVGFAACAHKDQRRKYTEDPYLEHCIAVGQIVSVYTDDIDVISAAILHDTVEDTAVTLDDIEAVFGASVAQLVAEVTDVSRLEDGNRAARKQIDRDHIAKSSPEGATIKLADLIHNTSTIVKYDPGFAKIYLQEKALLLPLLIHGNSELWKAANEQLQEVRETLETTQAGEQQ